MPKDNMQPEKIRQNPKTPSGDWDLRLVRPLPVPSILMRGHWIDDTHIERITFHYLKHARIELKKQLRNNLVALAAMGEQSTPEQWKACMDDSLHNADMRRDDGKGHPL